MKHTIVIIPGDGIGPEVSEAMRRILAAANAEIQWIERYAGLAALDRGAKDVLPAETVEAILEHGVAIKGPCTTPIGGGFSSINVALRKKLNLYGAVRPVRSLKGVPTRYENVDLIVVRENTEGLYSGIENIITPGVITSLKVATDDACRENDLGLGERFGLIKFSSRTDLQMPSNVDVLVKVDDKVKGGETIIAKIQQ